MEEIAEAVKEVAKATGLAIEKVAQLGQFFARAMGEPIDATCGMLADTLKYKRWERQIKLVEKAELLIKEKNLSEDSIPISAKLTLPIFQNASLEEDEFLHGLYAKLLVSAIDPKVQTRRTAFVEILRQLEPLDVRILQAMYAEYIRSIERYERLAKEGGRSRSQRPSIKTPIYKKDLFSSLVIKEHDYWEAVDNLCRLGLADYFFEEGSIDIETSEEYLSRDVVTSHGGYETLCITALGLSFVKICNY